MTTLLDLQPGQSAEVMGMSGGFRMQVQLKNLGFHEGVRITLLKKSAIGGPLMVAVNGSHVAVGRGVAARIEVAPVNGGADEKNPAGGTAQQR